MFKATHKRSQPSIKNPDRICVICGNPYTAIAPLQKTCSHDCRVIKYKLNQSKFKENNPDKMKGYNQRRLAKDPDVWIRKSRQERSDIIDALGDKCLVCGVTNKNWLHVDYAPTMKGTGLRHPRHKRWVMDNLKDFRLLCANHHYELSITGMIEGSDITQ